MATPDVKAQWVRLFDVFVLGPAMVYAATKLPRSQQTLAWFIGAMGVSTTLYNGRNWLKVRAEQELAERVAAGVGGVVRRFTQ